MRRLLRFLRLSARERALLFAAAMALLAVARRVRRDPMRALTIGGMVSDPPRRAATPREIEWAVGVAAEVLPGRFTCLMRALAMQRLLARAGIASEVRLGVARGDAVGIAAHAWVELADGSVLGEAGAQEFVPLPALPRE